MLLRIAPRQAVQLTVVRQKQVDVVHDQPPAMRRCTRRFKRGERKSWEWWCCGSKGCRIDVRDML
eukprot:1637473-Prymnesium_polylepis.1